MIDYKAPYKFLLHNLVVCPHCGKTMSAVFIPYEVNDNVIQFPVGIYVCPDKCGEPFNAPQLDQEVIDYICKAFKTDSFKKAVLNYILEDESEEHDVDENEAKQIADVTGFIGDNFNCLQPLDLLRWTNLLVESINLFTEPSTDYLKSLSFNFRV